MNANAFNAFMRKAVATVRNKDREVILVSRNGKNQMMNANAFNAFIPARKFVEIVRTIDHEIVLVSRNGR